MTTEPPAISELERYGEAQVPLPRIAIKFCVQCRWNLRAAYFAQELLSTFSTALGEVSLIPSTSGTFVITLLHRSTTTTSSASTATPSTPTDSAATTTSSSITTPSSPTDSAATTTSSSIATPSTPTDSAATTTLSSIATPSTPTDSATTITETVLWDRKTDGGFPETKELKNRVRNIVEPGRDLGHVDRSLKKAKEAAAAATGAVAEDRAVMREVDVTLAAGATKGDAQQQQQQQQQEEAIAVVADTDPASHDATKECEDCQ